MFNDDGSNNIALSMSKKAIKISNPFRYITFIGINMSAEWFNFLWEQTRGNFVSMIKSQFLGSIFLLGENGKAFALRYDIFSASST